MTTLSISRTRCVLLAVALSGCQVVTATLPPGVPDPNSTHNPPGAVALYEGAIFQFRAAFAGAGAGDSFVPVTGLLTDELQSGDIGLASSFSSAMLVDSRVLKEYTDPRQDNQSVISDVYNYLQETRGQARQARGALGAYAPNAPKALAGHLEAIEGYADVFLADLFCSGIPLSTLNFGGDFTYQPGSSTEVVYQHAVAFFDSALAVVGDSARILNMARVGKGRALLALGQYADAAAAVAQVPDEFQYAIQFNTAVGGNVTGTPSNNGFENLNFAGLDFGQHRGIPLTMVDREGMNGLPFESGGDPRSAWTLYGTNGNGIPLSSPMMYDAAGDSPIVLASGIEARLIQAEAALPANAGSWLTTLNAIRTDGTFDTQPDSADSTKTDTLWHAGTGGVSGLKPLVDPGGASARVTLLFDERAYWLFLTGHRQGDLRRLIRQYGRPQEQVYPIGSYPGAYNSYGIDVTAPIPGNERISNSLFTGCRNRGA
jgi:hypothetical protein